MSPRHRVTSSTTSSKKKDKERRTTPRRLAPAIYPMERMEVDEAMNGRFFQIYQQGPKVLTDLDISNDNWDHRRHEREDIPKSLPPHQPIGDSEHGQGYLHLLPPKEVNVGTTQDAGPVDPAFGSIGQVYPDADYSADTSESYLTDPDYLEYLFSLQTRDVTPQFPRNLRDAEEHPWLELPILYTDKGFPYSRLAKGPKPCICRWYGCNRKTRTFENMAGLKKHQKHHLDKAAMPFQCPQCLEGFAERHWLARHFTTKHTDERPFACDKCGESFQREDFLTNHKRRIHKNSTIGSSDGPVTASTGQSVGLPSTYTTSSSALELQSMSAQMEYAEIESNYSDPCRSSQNQGPYY